MGLLGFLFGRDLTRDWVPNRRMRLEIDLARLTLCGVAVDARIEQLEGLGPAENRSAARSGKLHYYSKGLQVEVQDGLLHGFTVYWDEPGYRPWPGTAAYERSPIPLDAGTTPEKLLELAGEPDEREDDEEGTSLEYFTDDGWCDIQFDVDGRLISIFFG